LTNPESQKTGLGDICKQKTGVVEVMQLDFEQLPERFRGKSMIEQHEMVMKILGGR
jgi:hypothetical protein